MSLSRELERVLAPVFCAGAQGIIISSPVNRRYLTGFDSTDGYLLAMPDKAVFLTDSRYVEAAQNTVTCCRTQLLTDAKTQLPGFFEGCAVRRIALEAQRLTVAELERLKEYFGETELLPGEADKALNAARAIKTPEETEKIRAAQRIAEKAFDYIIDFARPGMTERRVALSLDYYMLENGAQALSFETIAVSGANSSLPHGVPSDKKIEKGDFLTLDFGAVADGYHSDMTRTVIFGEPSAEQRRVYDTVLAAQRASLAVLKQGVTCVDADAAARSVIEQAGYGGNFGHGTGHGVGLEIHEPVNLSPKSGDTLKAGHVVTVEPGIYLPGRFGVRIEDMALITADGCINLTGCAKELIVL